MLMLHTDTQNAEREELSGLPVPAPTQTWQPIGHDTFDHMVRHSLTQVGIVVKKSSYGLSDPTPEGYRHKLFAVLETQHTILNNQVGLTIGLRNSTDMSMSAGMVYGSRVFVCDNMAFAGEYVIKRKHTTGILDDLPGLINSGIGQYFQEADRQRVLFEHLQNHTLTERSAYHTMVTAASEGIIPYSAIKTVRQEWHEPAHPDFTPRNAWSLYNAFTECMKHYASETTVNRTLKLTGFFHTLLN